eukprot:2163468-Lingulodinium_polyedra.AAC.1
MRPTARNRSKSRRIAPARRVLRNNNATTYATPAHQLRNTHNARANLPHIGAQSIDISEHNRL